MWDVRSVSAGRVMTAVARVAEVRKKKDITADYHVGLCIKEVIIVSSWAAFTCMRECIQQMVEFVNVIISDVCVYEFLHVCEF
jgi:hypothetical protein